eukprot:4070860-Amphidinium_carterae.2
MHDAVLATAPCDYRTGALHSMGDCSHGFHPLSWRPAAHAPHSPPCITFDHADFGWLEYADLCNASHIAVKRLSEAGQCGGANSFWMPGVHTPSSPTLPAACAAGTGDTADACEQSDFETFTVLTWNSLSLAGDKEAKVLTNRKSTSVSPHGLCQPGSLSHLTDKLAAEGVTVACIQESCLTLPEDFTTTKFHVLQNPATRGVGGLLVLVAKATGLRLAQHRCYGARVMTVRVQFHSTAVYLINAHAPIRRAPPEDHAEFAAQLQNALARQPPGSILIGGADLNARLAVVPSEISV